MQVGLYLVLTLAAALSFSKGGQLPLAAQGEGVVHAGKAGGKGGSMHHADGSFEVKLTPAAKGDSPIGRQAIDKTFHGGLEATSRGEMMAFVGSEKGSAGYVAMELVTGKLDGKSGSFVLQHSATMDRGAPTMSVTVVPDSGTGELKTLAGSMTIVVKAGEHGYTFDYTL